MMRPRFPLLFGVLLGVLGHAAVAGAQAGTGSWVSIGPDGIGAIQSLAIDPTATATLYAGTDGAGVYKSMDGAATWATFSSGLTDFSVLAIAVDPAIPSIVYAGTPSGLFVSLDSGSRWAPVGGLPRTVFGRGFDPASASTIYAVSTDAGVFKSSDAERAGLRSTRASPGPTRGLSRWTRLPPRRSMSERFRTACTNLPTAALHGRRSTAGSPTFMSRRSRSTRRRRRPSMPERPTAARTRP